jgi:hypothetical protein
MRPVEAGTTHQPTRSCETFCRRAAERVTGVLDQVKRNDDERVVAIAKLDYKRGEHGYAFFEA